MSAYEELVERCRKAANTRTDLSSRTVKSVLAEVMRTLENVTPEMGTAVLATYGKPDKSTAKLMREHLARDWIAMLRASPISPPKDGSP
jgi:hypothetical protein